jgi:hypothetical protein
MSDFVAIDLTTSSALPAGKATALCSVVDIPLNDSTSSSMTGPIGSGAVASASATKTGGMVLRVLRNGWMLVLL